MALAAALPSPRSSDLLSGVLGKSVLMLWQKNKGWGVKVSSPGSVPPFVSGEHLLPEPGLALLSLPISSAAAPQDPPVCIAQPGFLHLGTGIFFDAILRLEMNSPLFLSPPSPCAFVSSSGKLNVPLHYQHA